MTISWWIIWLVATVVLAIFEILTFMVVGLCLAVGTLGAFIAAICGAPLQVQLVVLAVVAIISFISSAPLVRRFKALRPAGAPSNMDALIGRTVTVGTTEPLRAKVDGDVWQVRSADESTPLRPGSRARIVGYDSIVLLLRPEEEIKD